MLIDNVLAIFVLVIAIVTSRRMHPLSKEFIDFINSNQTLWRAGRNFHRNTPLKYLKRLAGTIKGNPQFDDGLSWEPPRHKFADSNLPYHFDAREKWKNCPSLSDIRDQGSCGSCWAVSTVSAMSDRLCIQSKGREKINFSELDIMSCCMRCGGFCAGGILYEAWNYVVKIGTVSGGKYHSNEGCKPYTIEPCDHNADHHGNRTSCVINNKKPNAGVCERKCINPKFRKPYRSDKRRIAIYYKLTDARKIMAEIYEFGPVTTRMSLYEDFFNYKSGVYRYVGGKFVGYHSIKLLGWGEEAGFTYWLAANSWNTDWGHKGFFKIIRGVNHLNIETEMYTGLFHIKPKHRHLSKP